MSDGARAARLDLLPAVPQYFVDHLFQLTEAVRAALLEGRATGEADSDIIRESGVEDDYTGDTIYRIDERAETALLERCAAWARDLGRPFTLIAEGLSGDGRIVFPDGADLVDSAFECIVDPIDGTRGLMYDKRSAWALAGIAPAARALGRPPALSDVVIAIQAELPTRRARYADTVWAVAGRGACAETLDLTTGERRPARLRPSSAGGLAHGFATISKFFPGTKERAVWVEERLFAAVAGDHAAGVPLVFDDEYVSSGGQLYELLAGHDRFVADLRPVLMDAAGGPGIPGVAGAGTSGVRRLCARPYDLCAALVAEESGVIVTDAWGRPLAAPLDTTSDVHWAGYANQTIHALVEPVLHRLLRELGARP